MAWGKLGSADGDGSGGFSITDLTEKKFIQTLVYFEPSAYSYASYRFNNDSGSNYTTRKSFNGATDITYTSLTQADVGTSSNSSPQFMIFYIINNSSNEKLGVGYTVNINSTGAGNAPNRTENVLKWTNTSSQITDIEFKRSSGNMTAGQIKVWGSN